MKQGNIKRFSLEEILEMEDQTDWERLAKEGDYEGPQEFEVDWSTARLVVPDVKKAISLRVDQEVLDFFKSQGKGYQTRINAVLRSYMEAVKAGQA